MKISCSTLVRDPSGFQFFFPTASLIRHKDSAIDDNNLNIFLEYVPGGSVASLLKNYGAFEESLTANWVKQILRGLEYLHGQTIIHRDIKGANILVDNKGGIKISDFGISKKVEEGISAYYSIPQSDCLRLF